MQYEMSHEITIDHPNPKLSKSNHVTILGNTMALK